MLAAETILIQDSWFFHFYTVKRDLPSLSAVLLTPRGRVQSVPVRIASEYAQGEPVMVMGYSENAIAEGVLIVTSGVIGGRAVWGSSTTGIPYFIMNAEISYGASGGPVFNVDGEVVGFLDGGGNTEPFSYAIDITGRSFEYETRLVVIHGEAEAPSPRKPWVDSRAFLFQFGTHKG